MKYIDNFKVGRKINRELLAVLAITFFVLLANSIYLFGNRPDPLLQRSGLGTVVASSSLAGTNTIDPNDGFTSQALGTQAAKMWIHGKVPFWNYYESIGSPLAGEMQSAALFPLVILLNFSNGLLMIHIILEIIAGLSTYYFFRKLSVRWSLALCAGIIFAVNGTFSWLANAAFNPVAFLPLALLGVEIILSSIIERKKRGWLVLSLAVALSLYAGFPETAYIDGLFVIGWAMTRSLLLARKDLINYYTKLLVAGILGILLAAPILVSFVDYLPFAFTGQHSDGFANAALVSQSFPALIYPYIYGPIFGYNALSTSSALTLFWGNIGGYIDTSLLLGAILGAISKLKNITRVYLLVWITLCLGRIYGQSRPLHLINILPGIKSTAFYRYSPPSLEFAVLILAIYGFNAALGKAINRTYIALSIFACFALLVIAALSAKPELHTLLAYPNHHIWAISSILWGFVIFTVCAICMVFSENKLAAKILPVAIVLDALILFAVPQLSTPDVKGIDLRPVSYLQKNLGLNRFYTLGPIQPNYGSYFDIASINENDLPVPKIWANYVTKSLNNNTSPITFTGNTELNANGLTDTQELIENLKNYENVGVKYVVSIPGQITNSEARLASLSLKFSDKYVSIYKLPHYSPYFTTPSKECSMSDLSLNYVHVFCKRPTMLARNELYMKGWQATVNGKSVNVSKYSDLFESVKLKAGSSDVSFKFIPAHMSTALLSIIFAVAVLVALPAYDLFAKKKYKLRLLK